MAKKATRKQTRIHNRQLVLSTIYERGETTRAKLARITRLTRPTVSDVVADLIAEGLVEEVGYAPSTGGKRAILLRVDVDSRHLIGIDLAREDFRGAIINLHGEIKHRVNLPLENRDGDAALALVYDLVDALIKAPHSPLLGIGIGTPGLIDAVNGVIDQAVNLNWRDVPLRDLLQKHYDLPVYVANDCQVAALAEFTFGKSDHNKDLVVINVGKGIGAGIILEGHLFHGNPLGAGEIGHVMVVENGERCQCGNYGCLETVANTRAITRQAQAAAREKPESTLNQLVPNPEAITFNTVSQAFALGDEATRAVIRNVGRSLGIAMANLVGVLGSCRILISGRITEFGQFLLDTLKEELRRRTLASLATATEIGFVSLGSDIVPLGAAALLLPHELGLLSIRD